MNPSRNKIFGIVNLTDDSFSDGGFYNNTQSFTKIINQFVDYGIYGIDIGASSTRPDASIQTFQDEIEILNQFLPTLQIILKKNTNKIKFSLDSYNLKTVEHCLQYNLNTINDVNGLKDERFIDLLIQNSKLDVIFMHSLTIPANKNITMPQQGVDLINEISNFASIKIAKMLDKGIDISRIIFDPGIGFGKTSIQSLYIMKNIETIKATIKTNLGFKQNHDIIKIMIGHSRKSVLKDISGFLPTNNKKEDNKVLDYLTKITTNTILTDADFIRIHNPFI